MKDWLKRFGGNMNWPTKLTGNNRGSLTDPFGDYDGDGVPNMNDCQPRNPKKQDKMISSASSLSINKTYPRAPGITGAPITSGGTKNPADRIFTPGILMNPSHIKFEPQMVKVPEGAGSKAVIMPMPPKYTPMPIRPQPVPPKIIYPIGPQPGPKPQPKPGQFPIRPIPMPETIQKKIGISAGQYAQPVRFYRDGVLTPMPIIGTKINPTAYTFQEGDRFRTSLSNGIGFTERVYTGGQWITRTVR